MTCRRLSAAVLVVLAGLAGCGQSTPTPGVQGEVSGTVTTSGKPVKDLAVYFHPTGGAAQPTALKIGADGTFSGSVVAGKYSWYLVAPADAKPADQAKAATALKTIPAAYLEASMDRQIDVAGGTKLTLEVK